MPGVTNKQNNFDQLVQALSEKLGPCSGIDSDDVDENELQQLMQDYVSEESEWSRYYFESSHMPYTRNLVDKGNGKSSLLILVWTPGRESPIHDHANAHCIMKILRGSLTETRFAWPTIERNKNEDRPLQVLSKKTFEQNQVTYMSDKLGLHRITNPDPSNYAVSLHLYTPPNAAVYGCNTFTESNGQPHHMKTCSTYSEYGIRNRSS
ncbi:cysteine dioxygenase type I [Setomelanomma holmii]|uniref:Cysteine dioxygenase n=1 Tax=Setomelanomma holmii TaxID=210430 RepID=A0A9P4HBP0_9PLEO|nr:cysteine dioxygenase type I [Setomelanomma holmii]